MEEILNKIPIKLNPADVETNFEIVKLLMKKNNELDKIVNLINLITKIEIEEIENIPMNNVIQILEKINKMLHNSEKELNEASKRIETSLKFKMDGLNLYKTLKRK